MKIHHLRNATFVIESGAHFILIDPMLGEKGSLPPFAVFRHKAKKNPIVSLPPDSVQILEQVTHCLITHSQRFGLKPFSHLDHLDGTGESFLLEKNLPVVCPANDAAYLKKHGINVQTELNYWQPEQLLGGKITAVPAKHGHSWMHYFMANGAGFYLTLPDEPSIYISGDTVYTDDVKRALRELKPDIAVVAAGCASLDVGGPILMTVEEVVSFVTEAPGKVVANHLEALNHCPVTRAQLKHELQGKGLLTKTFVPDDGEVLNIELD